MADDFDRINGAALLLARGRPQQPALVCDGRTVPYGELRKSIARAATVWQEHGVAPGEVVMLRGDHRLDHVIAFLGAIWAGAVPVPLRNPIDPGDVMEGARRAPVRFVLEGRGGAPGERGARWQEWQPDTLRDAPPAPAVGCEPWSPACWTDPRIWDAAGARILPHRFALALIAVPGTLQLAPTGTMLGVLRALRRGVTAVLQARETPQALAA